MVHMTWLWFIIDCITWQLMLIILTLKLLNIIEISVEFFFVIGRLKTMASLIINQERWNDRVLFWWITESNRIWPRIDQNGTSVVQPIQLCKEINKIKYKKKKRLIHRHSFYNEWMNEWMSEWVKGRSALFPANSSFRSVSNVDLNKKVQCKSPLRIQLARIEFGQCYYGPFKTRWLIAANSIDWHWNSMTLKLGFMSAGNNRYCQQLSNEWLPISLESTFNSGEMLNKSRLLFVSFKSSIGPDSIQKELELAY